MNEQNGGEILILKRQGQEEAKEVFTEYCKEQGD